MIRLVTEQDGARVLSLCRKDAWDGTELLAAYSARCADKGGVDWRRCDLWIGESETQKKNIQYLLCRVGENYRLVGAPRSPTRWEELHAFLQLQPAGTLTAREEVVDEYCRRFSPEGQERARGGTRMLCQRIPNDITGSVVTECQSLWEIYDVLLSQKPELSQRVSRDEYTARMLFLKRGGALFFEVREQNRPVAVGGIQMPPGGEYGLIFNLCTRPDCAGRGYGTQLVDRLCLEAFWQGRTPALECCGTRLETYYQRLGFEGMDRWKSLPLHPQPSKQKKQDQEEKEI